MYGEGHLPQRLLLLAKMIERVTSRQLQTQFGMSVAQWRVLAFICGAGPATASQISQSAEIDQAEISRAVKALLAGKMVTREFARESRKIMMISPTEQGEARFRHIRDQRRDYFAAITGTLENGRKAEFDYTLELIARAVSDLRDRSESKPAQPPRA